MREREQEASPPREDRTGQRSGNPGAEVERGPVLRRALAGAPILEVGAADDAQEAAADALADRVMRHLAEPVGAPAADPPPAARTGVARRSFGAPVADDAIGAEGGGLTPDLSRRISSRRGLGQRLPSDTLDRMEGAFGTDLSSVRVHNDSDAAGLSRQLSASAFTIGTDIFFGRGQFDPASTSGQQLLAHELAHVVREGGVARRKVVRRKLIPKAQEALDAAIALNPGAFTQAKQNVDDHATESEQEDLSKVHGRFHDSKKDTDQEKALANMIRAAVLKEFGERVSKLPTARDPDTNALLSEKEKKKKRGIYRTKAGEYRQSLAPLLKKGMEAPETVSFLKQQGLVGGGPLAQSPQQQAAMRAGGARIDVRSTFIGGKFLGKRMRSHLFIVYTAKDGRQMYFRGGPSGPYPNLGNILAEYGDYTAANTTDWDPSAPSVTLLEGAEAERKLDKLIEAAKAVNQAAVPYEASLAKQFGGNKPNKLQSVANLVSEAVNDEGENCNAAAWTMLTRAGIKPNKPSGKHPGWGSIVGSKTEGKEDALPQPETDGLEPTPYKLSAGRDLQDDKGLVRVYRDRAMFDLLARMPIGTSVTLLDEEEGYRKIRTGTETGYIQRAERDQIHVRLSQWMFALQRDFSDDEIQHLSTLNPGDDEILRAAEDTGIPAHRVARMAKFVVDGAEHRTAFYLDQRLADVGDAQARSMLDDPYEIETIAARADTTPEAVVAALQERLTQIDIKISVQSRLAALAKQRGVDLPTLYSELCSEVPNFTMAKQVAAEMHVTYQAIVSMTDSFRPSEQQGGNLSKCIQEDPIILNELDNPMDYIVKDFARKSGVSEDFVRKQLLELHKHRAKEKEMEKILQEIQADEQRDAEDDDRVWIKQAFSERLGSAAMIPFILNDVPHYATIVEIAEELEISPAKVFDLAYELRPKSSGDTHLGALFSELTTEELEHIAAETSDKEQDWGQWAEVAAKKLGVTTEYIVHRAAESLKVDVQAEVEEVGQQVDGVRITDAETLRLLDELEEMLSDNNTPT